MGIGTALLVILVGLVIAAFLNGTIGWIVVIVGLVGLIVGALRQYR